MKKCLFSCGTFYQLGTVPRELLYVNYLRTLRDSHTVSPEELMEKSLPKVQVPELKAPFPEVCVQSPHSACTQKDPEHQQLASHHPKNRTLQLRRTQKSLLITFA